MSIHDILAQLNSMYGKPDAQQTTETNEAMFRMLIQTEPDPRVCFPLHQRMPRGGYP